MRLNALSMIAYMTVVGCASNGEDEQQSGVGSSGGSGPSNTGSVATGGRSPNTSSATGGAPLTIGGSSVGGTPTAGGSSQLGTSSATGGVQSSTSTTTVGGRSTTSSNTTAGARQAGGVMTMGGAAGTPVTTGGRVTVGGASSASNAGAGGKTTAGGGSGPSTTAAGGKTAAGGSTASAGTATAGAAARGGASGTLPKFVGNITTGNSVNPSGLTYSKYWDQLTPENAGKWGSVQSSPSSAFNWATLDAFYEYTQTNKIIFKHHTFVWGKQQPSGTPTLAQVENWIKTFCQRYPNTKIIDVVNEPPPHTTPSYTANLGAGETGSYPWITKAFKLARQYCGNAVLLLNDYNNIEYADQENHFIDIVKDIKKAGAPIDAVGAQAHGLHGFTAAQIKTNIDKMVTGTGLPVYITEYDIADASDSTQQSIISSQFQVFWQHPSVHGITIWGWINGRTWVENTGLVNNTTPRPAMTWLMNYLDRPVPPN